MLHFPQLSTLTISSRRRTRSKWMKIQQNLRKCQKVRTLKGLVTCSFKFPLHWIFLSRFSPIVLWRFQATHKALGLAVSGNGSSRPFLCHRISRISDGHSWETNDCFYRNMQFLRRYHREQLNARKEETNIRRGKRLRTAVANYPVLIRYFRNKIISLVNEMKYQAEDWIETRVREMY